MPQQPSPDQLDIAEITEPSDVNKEADAKTVLEEEDLARQERDAYLRGLLQDMSERKKYAGRIFWLLAIWLIGVFVLLVCQGSLSPWKLFALSDAVLLAAIGGTTINVIGIFLVVARYLFPQRVPSRPATMGRGRS